MMNSIKCGTCTHPDIPACGSFVIFWLDVPVGRKFDLPCTAPFECVSLIGLGDLRSVVLPTEIQTF
jgi:hypothetical protein